MTPEPPNDWLDLVAGRPVDPDVLQRLRRPGVLSDAERRRLEQEIALNELIDGHRPMPSVSSNFTARVLDEVRRAERQTGRSARGGWAWGWIPRFLLAGGLAMVGVVLWTQGHNRHAIRLAEQAAVLGAAANAAGLDATTLADFEVIRRLAADPRPEDDALILALAE